MKLVAWLLLAALLCLAVGSLVRIVPGRLRIVHGKAELAIRRDCASCDSLHKKRPAFIFK
jgi:hypothetical protein